MFDWKDFFCALIVFSVVILILCLIASGFYMICGKGNVWGFALIVGGFVLGGSVAIGFGV